MLFIFLLTIFVFSGCLTGPYGKIYSKYDKSGNQRIASLRLNKFSTEGRSRVMDITFTNIITKSKTSSRIKLFAAADAGETDLQKKATLRINDKEFEIVLQNRRKTTDSYEDPSKKEEERTITYHLLHGESSLDNIIVEHLKRADALMFILYIDKEIFTYRFSKSEIKKIRELYNIAFQ